ASPFGARVGIAAINSPRSLLVSGEREAVEGFVAEVAATGVFAKKVQVSYASHSPDVDLVRDGLLADLAGVAPRRAAVPLLSTVRGHTLAGPELDAAYWYENLRQPVRFHEATARLLASGHRFFVELSPHPVLKIALEETFEH